MDTVNSLPVVIIGGGPVGLAAAAHLAVRRQPFLLFERGAMVGANIQSWQHVRVFSPWRFNIDKAARQLLEANGWRAPDDEAIPTGKELYDFYFKPLSEVSEIRPSIHLNSSVIAAGRKGLDKVINNRREQLPFVIQVRQNGQTQFHEARAVIDASGTWLSPNPIGSGGIYADGELQNFEKIFYGIPDIQNLHKNRYKNKSVLVVGGGHSAINSILALNDIKDEFPETEIHWVLRKDNLKKVYGGQENDALPARGALGVRIEQLVNDNRVNVYTPFYIQQIVNEKNRLSIVGHQNNQFYVLPGIDEIICNTGSRPDFSFLREIRLNIDHAIESVANIAELIDPNVHSCGTVRAHGEAELRQPEKDFYIVGSKSYGRAPTFLMATGYEQVRSVVAGLVGDWEAARRVELELPETGVCSTDFGEACCGVSPEAKTSACCA
ncbi:NAD(P)-binding domain-containing protein [bacterium]|nr:NAD(P)-binding domain-containing protein [bacterium]